jgi:hypothetical protein
LKRRPAFAGGPEEGVSLTYEFDSYLLIVQQVCPLKNDTERAFADLLANTIVHTDDIRGRGGH